MLHACGDRKGAFDPRCQESTPWANPIVFNKNPSGTLKNPSCSLEGGKYQSVVTGMSLGEWPTGTQGAANLPIRLLPSIILV